METRNRDKTAIEALGYGGRGGAWTRMVFRMGGNRGIGHHRYLHLFFERDLYFHPNTFPSQKSGWGWLTQSGLRVVVKMNEEAGGSEGRTT